MGIFHSTATLSSEGACGLYGVYASCTVQIFSCPTSALGLGGPLPLLDLGSNPNHMFIFTLCGSIPASLLFSRSVARLEDLADF